VDWYWWLLMALVLGIVEIATVDLVFIMLAAGAVAGGLVSAVGAPLVAQAVVAAAVAVLMLAVVRPVALRHLRQPVDMRTGTAALVGSQAVVLERVDRHDGRVKLKGEVWSARSYDPAAVIEPGAMVDVISIDGATVVVLSSEM
jgi:membrane protein implicated in regulation of membrane protease activity